LPSENILCAAAAAAPRMCEVFARMCGCVCVCVCGNLIKAAAIDQQYQQYNNKPKTANKSPK